MNQPQLTLDDLAAGDVLLFSVLKGDFISSMIGLLTNSNVSHAALFADEARQTILEATGDSPVLENKAAPRFAGRNVYVCRRRQPLDATPVVAAGRRHVEAKTMYGGIYTLGALLVTSKYARLRWNESTSQAVVTLLAATYNLLRTWAEREDGKVFCSQFVDQCFEEAGEAYRLHFDPGTVILLAGESISLLESVSACADAPELQQSALLDETPERQNVHEACRLLHDALVRHSAAPEGELTAWKPNWKVLLWTARVIWAWFCLATHRKSWKNFWTPSELRQACAWLEQQRSSMIAPSDFRHAEELEEIGVLADNR